MRPRLLFFAALLTASAQPRPQFEIASIKPADPDGLAPIGMGGPGSRDPGTLAITRVTLRDLIFQAYRVKPYQLSAPAWMDGADRFDLFARVPTGAAKADVPLMLQDLLDTRFHLKIHRASRETAAYVLTIGKNGSKLPAYPAVLPPDFVEAPKIAGYDRDGVPIVRSGYSTGMMGTNDGRTSIAIARQPIDSLCAFLSRVVEQPVVDRTGLTGRYDVHLFFAAESVTADTGSSDPAPPLAAAIEAQLGLRLEPRKVPVDFLVVDSADRRPSEN